MKGKRTPMSKLTAFRELPDTMKQVSALAVFAVMISLTALIVAVARHGS
jgi:hypothetical protein